MWMEQIVVALITAGLGLVGVMITNYFSNKSLGDKVQHQLEVSQAVTETKIEELTRRCGRTIILPRGCLCWRRK